MDGKLRCMTSIYLTKGNRILLLYRQGGRVVNEVWVGAAGGHMEPEEIGNAEAGVLRELNEELGLTKENLSGLSMRYVTMIRRPGELRQNYYFFAELKEDVEENLVSNEGICKWFELEELPSLKMPYTSEYVTKHYLETGRFTDKLYGGVADGKGMVFTEMPEF